MEEVFGFIAEETFGAAGRAARRRRSRRWAEARGLGWFPDGPSAAPAPEAARPLRELRELGLPVEEERLRNIVIGAQEGRWVAAFEHASVWNRGRKRKYPYQFTAVRLQHPGADLLVSRQDDTAERTAAEDWFKPGSRCLPVPRPGRADRSILAADPAFATALIGSVTDAGPLDRTWMLRGHWLVGWKRGRLKVKGEHGAERQLRFLLAIAGAAEQTSA